MYERSGIRAMKLEHNQFFVQELLSVSTREHRTRDSSMSAAPGFLSRVMGKLKRKQGSEPWSFQDDRFFRQRESKAPEVEHTWGTWTYLRNILEEHTSSSMLDILEEEPRDPWVRRRVWQTRSESWHWPTGRELTGHYHKGFYQEQDEKSLEGSE